MFGLINFANVLPLKFFFKSGAFTTQFKSAILHHSATPSQLNVALSKRRIKSTISSSIISLKSKYHNAPVGICASSAVLSVLCDFSQIDGTDEHSATSNALASVLGASGQVIIGDRALKFFCDKLELNNVHDFAVQVNRPKQIRRDFIKHQKVRAFKNSDFNEKLNRLHIADLCSLWAAQTALPFTFARFSTLDKRPAKWLKSFASASDTPSKRTKIPRYLLEKEAAKRGLKSCQIKEYLKFIHYKIAAKEQKALRFYARKIRAKRFERSYFGDN